MCFRAKPDVDIGVPKTVNSKKRVNKYPLFVLVLIRYIF